MWRLASFLIATACGVTATGAAADSGAVSGYFTAESRFQHVLLLFTAADGYIDPTEMAMLTK